MNPLKSNLMSSTNILVSRALVSHTFNALLQDIGWFDMHPAGQLPTMVTSLMSKVQDGIGRKVPDIVMNGGGAVGCLIAAFILNPVLAGIVISCLPVMVVAISLVAKLMSKSTLEGQGHYGKAGAVANEVRVQEKKLSKEHAVDIASWEHHSPSFVLQKWLTEPMIYCLLVL